jgi:hypothetical protein
LSFCSIILLDIPLTFCQIEWHVGKKRYGFGYPSLLSFATSIEYHKEVIIKEIERKLVDKREGTLWAKEISNVVA